MNVPTSPTIRIEILSVRFMGFVSYPLRVFPYGTFFAEPHYRTRVKFRMQQFSSHLESLSQKHSQAD